MICFGSFLSPAFEAFAESDFIGKLIVLIQIGMSVVSWATMMKKWVALKDIKMRSSVFVDNFIKEEDSLALYYKRYPFGDTPIEEVYVKTCERLASLVPPEKDKAVLAFPRKRMELVETT